jgi:O-antigen/teichoic acid export membrane protein
MLRRILPAANAIFVGHMIPRLGSIILVPLFLKTWSATLYGEYLALFAAVTYLSSLDIGMQQASVNRLTQAYAKRDLDAYRTVQHTTIAFYVILATIVTIIVVALAWSLPLSRWIGLKLTAPVTGNKVIVLLAVYVMWSLPVRLITATYQSTGNLARTQWIGNLQQIAVVILSAVVLIGGGGMLSIAYLQVATVGFIGAFVLFDLRRTLPALFPGLKKAHFSALQELAHPSLLFALLLVGNLIAFQGSTLIVSALLGGLAVAVLSISKAMIDVIRQVLYSITLALCPDLARMEVLGEFEQLRTVHRLAVAATATITLALAASVWYEGAQIITVWTRGRIEPDVVLLRLFLVLLAFQTPWAASSTIGTATNRHAAQAIGYFFAAIIGVGLVCVLVRRLGTWAVPLGLTVGEAVCCYHFVVKSSCRTIGESYSSFALRFWAGFAAVTATVLTAGWFIHNVVPGPMLARWAAMGVFTLTAATACAWIVWLTPADRLLLSSKLRPLFKLSTSRLAPSSGVLERSSEVQELTQ